MTSIKELPEGKRQKRKFYCVYDREPHTLVPEGYTMVETIRGTRYAFKATCPNTGKPLTLFCRKEDVM